MIENIITIFNNGLGSPNVMDQLSNLRLLSRDGREIAPNSSLCLNQYLAPEGKSCMLTTTDGTELCASLMGRDETWLFLQQRGLFHACLMMPPPSLLHLREGAFHALKWNGGTVELSWTPSSPCQMIINQLEHDDGKWLTKEPIALGNNVLGQFLILDKDEKLFRGWLKAACNANKKHQYDC